MPEKPLMVDDDDIVLVTPEELLNPEGYFATMAIDGSICVKKVDWKPV